MIDPCPGHHTRTPHLSRPRWDHEPKPRTGRGTGEERVVLEPRGVLLCVPVCLNGLGHESIFIKSKARSSRRAHKPLPKVFNVVVVDGMQPRLQGYPVWSGQDSQGAGRSGGRRAKCPQTQAPSAKGSPARLQSLAQQRPQYLSKTLHGHRQPLPPRLSMKPSPKRPREVLALRSLCVVHQLLQVSPDSRKHA